MSSTARSNPYLILETGPTGPFSFYYICNIFNAMKKFFLFRRQEVSKSSTFASDSGVGLDLLGVSADLLAFMTAEEGKVRIVFNNASPYEDSNLVDGDSMQKTSVTVGCEVGKEIDVVESIMRFLGNETSRFNVMKFDAVDGFSNLKNISLSGVSDVVSQVRKTPVERATGEPSTRTFIGGTAGTTLGTGNTIQGIDFGSTDAKPVIDYNESGITVSSGTTINGWTNSGTGGSSYNATTNGSPTKITAVGRAGSGLSTVAADVVTTTYFILSTELFVEDGFTMYMVLADTPSKIVGEKRGRVMLENFFSSDGGTCFGIGGIDQNVENKFAIRFDTFTGAPATGLGNVAQETTDEDLVETMAVFVVRRDENNVVYIHDKTGEVVSIITDQPAEPTRTTRPTRQNIVEVAVDDGGKKPTVARSTNESGRTDGNLAIKNFGQALGAEQPKFEGRIGRFGVIQKDIGTERAAKLAIDLHKLYKPIS